MRTHVAVLPLLGAALLCLGGVARADDKAPAGTNDEAGNIRVTISIADAGDGNALRERSHELVVRDGASSSLTTGWRVPIPATRFDTASSSAGGIVPVTSFTYQTIGLTARVTARTLRGGRILLEGGVEISALDEPAGAEAKAAGNPTVGTFTQSFEIAVRPGKLTRVASVSKPNGGVLRLALGAEPLD